MVGQETAIDLDSSVNCTEESDNSTSYKLLLARRKVWLKSMNGTLDHLSQLLSNRNSSDRIKFHLGKLREKWTQVEKLNGQLDPLISDEETLEMEVELFINIKDIVDEMIDKVERHLQATTEPTRYSLCHSKSIQIDS